MNQTTQSHLPKKWSWPINVATYDRTTELCPEELQELRRKLSMKKSPFRARSWAILDRLLHPIEDVLDCIDAPLDKRRVIVRAMMCEMSWRGRSFWGWSLEEWRESISPNLASAAQRYGWKGEASHPARQFLPALAYLLDVHPDAGTLIDTISITAFARRIFGQEALDNALQSLLKVLHSWGYKHNATIAQFSTCVFYLLVQNRSPHIEDLSIELLERFHQSCSVSSVGQYVFQVSRALNALGVTERSLLGPQGKPYLIDMSEEVISTEWLSWCDRWKKQTTSRAPSTIYYPILKVGRWLRSTHPEITSPAQWNYELAVEFVAAVNDMKVGEWVDEVTLVRLNTRLEKRGLGKPMLPNTKASFLRCVRTFFRDCQEWEWIPVRFNPHRALRTPHSLWSRIGPAPRIIDKELWAKLLWAAINLQQEDLLVGGLGEHQYPFEMVRAIALVWCFAALRSNEIMRLRVGCIRWQHEDVMIPETGSILPRDAVCFLDIPVNKTMASYTKAVHPLVGQSINEWEKVRPRDQLPALDKTTGEVVHFLFSYRATCSAKHYINESLIPTLCRKAGIPREDSRGSITSHRARATIASMLYNAKEPLNIFELKEYLGHKALSSTQHYLKVDPTKLASRVAKAGYLEQNMATIEVLLDQDAILNGAAARGEVWKYYDLGHGFCTNSFWADCQHRMACARCPFYRPKDSLAEQLVEGKANLVRMMEFIKLTEDEKLLVTEGIDLHQTLIEKLANVPTPAGPTPRELEISKLGQQMIVPIESIQRNKGQQKE